HGIPVTPTNYRLWYEYFIGGPAELKETLDRLLKEGALFTPEITEALYQRFFSPEAAESLYRAVDEAGDKVQAMAAEMVKGLVQSAARTSEYNRNLESHSDSIQRASNLMTVMEVVSAIVQETKDVRRAQDNIQQLMEGVTGELNRLQDELERKEELALTDELTNLANRRAFNIRLAEEIGRSERYGLPVALIILDLDDFKKINDTYGHLVGDRLLAMTAKAIRGVIRETDLPARFGGEEFAVICPHTDLQGVCSLANRLCRAIDQTEFTVKGTRLKATLSAGAAMLQPSENAEKLIDRADRSLYLAKKLGKNRVCTENDSLSGESGQASDKADP
ncbi:MAG: diguanylate cyclase, partial [Pseudomonadota bacterium]